MAICPCCRKSLVDPVEPGQLCPECARALETGVDDYPAMGPPSAASESNLDDSRATNSMKRPLGVTLLAIQGYFCAAAYLISVIVIATGTNASVVLSNKLNHWNGSATASSLTPEFRIECALVYVPAACIIYFLSSGLWRLKNWARRIMMAILLLGLEYRGGPVTFFPLFALLPASPFLELLARVLSFLVLCYLITSSVKIAFRVPDLRRRWSYAIGALALVPLASALCKSGPEYKAFLWHRQHGNQITVNGVTFPVYAWYRPLKIGSCRDSGFVIWDQPGPLRPDDSGGLIRIEGCKSGDNAQTTEQLVKMKLQSDRKAGYTDLTRFQMQLREQRLECVENGSLAQAIDCYGDGPIRRVSFFGSDQARERFNRMLAEAR